MSAGSMGSIDQQSFTESAVFFHPGLEMEGLCRLAELADVEPLLPAYVQQSSPSAAAAASDALLLEHLSTVRFVARRIHKQLPQHVELEELVSAGTVGLIDAVAKFKNEKNTQFKTYAQFRIRGAILDSLRSLDWSPRELRRKGRSVEEAIRTSMQRLSRTPSDLEVAEEMGVTLKEYQRLLTELKALEIGSLNAERNEETGEEELAYVAAPTGDDPLFRCLEAEMKQHLVEAIDALPERERMVLTLYYYEELTLREIADLLGVVESRVSQIRSSAVLRVRSSLSAFTAKPRSKR
ncbi:MAG: RNA polymerase sigma factor WhiG [Acidobacteriaceae bacterium]